MDTRNLFNLVRLFFTEIRLCGFSYASSAFKDRFKFWWKYCRKTPFLEHTVDDAIHYAVSNKENWKDKTVWECLKKLRTYGLKSTLYDLRYRKKSKKTWERVCHSYLKCWGWNKQAREDFFDWGKYGFNNKDLHEDNTFQDFLAELHYCSDRMSLDRLFRCQVKFRNAVNNPEVKEDE